MNSSRSTPSASGTIKSYTITEQGDEQITGFHLAGDLVGFDAIHRQQHPSFAQALKPPWSARSPLKSSTIFRAGCQNCASKNLASDEQRDHGRSGDDPATVEEKCRRAIGRLSLQPLDPLLRARLLGSRIPSVHDTGDIGNYLGLTVETISRLLGRFRSSS